MSPNSKTAMRSAWIAVVVGGCALGAWGIPLLAESNRESALEQQHHQLFDDYLTPNFSAEFCQYWGINNLGEYKQALHQQYKIASFDHMTAAYGREMRELRYFHRRRIINWLEMELIAREEYQAQFRDRGHEGKAPFSIDLSVMSDQEFRERVPY